jgi:hypothetical protein
MQKDAIKKIHRFKFNLIFADLTMVIDDKVFLNE